MNLGDPPGLPLGQPETAGTFEEYALAHAQRRVVIVSGLLGGCCITGAGLAWALGALAFGGIPRNGLFMVAAGLGVLAIGWLATAWLRFTRTMPKPLRVGERVEGKTRQRIISGWIALGLVWAACLAAILFAPRGREPDAVAVLLMLAAIPAAMLPGLYRIRHIMRRRNSLFAAWLARHHP